MDLGQEYIFEDRRKAKAPKLKVTFQDASNATVESQSAPGQYYFVVLDGAEHGYECTCQSFYHGNTEFYRKTHSETFQCKHLMAAFAVRKANYPEDNRKMILCR